MGMNPQGPQGQNRMRRQSQGGMQRPAANSGSGKNNTGMIVGITVGAVILLALIGFGAYYIISHIQSDALELRDERYSDNIEEVEDEPVEVVIDEDDENDAEAPAQRAAWEIQQQMVRVPGGSRTLGATYEQEPWAKDSERPAHTVTLSSYKIGKYEVTQYQWEAIMGSNPSTHRGANRPVENVSWNDIQQFISRLNSLTGGSYRLPTEAEWEYAARGGEDGPATRFAGSDEIDEVGWYDGNSGGSTHPVGRLRPNRLGLYDMTGNVWEWCQDYRGRYNAGDSFNPKGPSSGNSRVGHGGGYDASSSISRVSFRSQGAQSYSSSSLGFRLASD